jgi:hypothetical protein
MEFMQHPAVRHHDMVREYEHPGVGGCADGPAARLPGTPTRDPGPPPTLGEHTDAVLREIGYTTTRRRCARGVCRRRREPEGASIDGVRGDPLRAADGVATITLNRPACTTR